MGRHRLFEDNELKEMWEEYNGVVKHVAEALGVTPACVYLHGSRLGLEKQKQIEREGRIRSGDRDFVQGFTHLMTIRKYARMHSDKPVRLRRRLLESASRLWSNNQYIDFPMPETPSDVQVFNFLNKINPDEFVDDCPLREDITYVTRNCQVRNEWIIDYHTRFLEHQAKLEELVTGGKRWKTAGQKAKITGKNRGRANGIKKKRKEMTDGKIKKKSRKTGRADSTGSKNRSRKKKKKFTPKRAAFQK